MRHRNNGATDEVWRTRIGLLKRNTRLHVTAALRAYRGGLHAFHLGLRVSVGRQAADDPAEIPV